MEEFIKKIAREAGEIALEGFGNAHVVYTKDDVLDLVTTSDLKSNEFIEGEIKKHYPSHGIISEELNDYQKEAEYVWVVDPIDGTVNFATGIPIFAVMIALLRDGEVEMSAIFDPVHDKLAFAKRDGGAYVNDKKIECSKTREVFETRGIMSFLPKDSTIRIRRELLNEAKKANVKIGINAFGCAGFNAVCVAEGARDWSIGFNTKIWDVAPCALLMKEAGCKITNHENEEWKVGDNIVAANEKLHGQLIEILKNIN